MFLLRWDTIYSLFFTLSLLQGAWGGTHGSPHPTFLHLEWSDYMTNTRKLHCRPLIWTHALDQVQPLVIWSHLPHICLIHTHRHKDTHTLLLLIINAPTHNIYVYLNCVPFTVSYLLTWHACIMETWLEETGRWVSLPDVSATFPLAITAITAGKRRQCNDSLSWYCSPYLMSSKCHS